MNDPNKISIPEKLFTSYQYASSESFLSVHETEISLNFADLTMIPFLKPIICEVQACQDPDQIEFKIILDPTGKMLAKVKITINGKKLHPNGAN